MTDRTLKVALIGIGAMGAPIAGHILAAGFPLAVYDTRAEALAPLRGRAQLATSPKDLGDKAEAVIGCLPTLASYKEALLGANGLCHGTAIKRYIHIGTTGGEFLRELAAGLERHGIETLDVPMTGGVPRAVSGKLTLIASGREASVEDVTPLLESYSSKIVYVGAGLGNAQTVKLINNMLSAASLAIGCEALTLGLKCGIPADQLLDVLNNGTGQSSATLTKIPNHVVPRTFDYGGSLAITLKDTDAYEQEATRMGVSSEIASAVRRAYHAAAKAGHQDADMTAIALHFEELAGMGKPPS
jgi:3-hydroxyisobutyrate dehydrogenase-like beta-hydroxyacid dehydrogenase